MKSGWWRHRYRQGLLVDVGNILYLILRNIFHPFSMSLHSVLLLKQQISFARMVQLWRAGNGILILTSLSEQRPRHDVCGISDRVCGDMQSILHACVRFLSLLNCSQMMKIMSSPAPKRFSDTPNPKQLTVCCLRLVLINIGLRARTTSTPLTVNLAIISSIRQGSLVCCFQGFAWFGVEGRNCDGDTADGSEIRRSPPGIKKPVVNNWIDY